MHIISQFLSEKLGTKKKKKKKKRKKKKKKKKKKIEGDTIESDLYCSMQDE